MTRRGFVCAAFAAAQASAKAFPRLCGTPTTFSVRAKNAKPFDIVEHCHQLGLGGTETGAPPSTPEAIRALRSRLDAYNMRVVFNVPMPKRKEDVEAFEAGVKNAREAGAFALHAAMTPRRYEQFDAFEPFKKSFEQNQLSSELAEPVLRKHRVRLAIENHKGWRAAEQAAWLKRLGSEYVRVAFDFGNNLSLCETPQETFGLLAPMAIMCHIKDMAVEPYEDGFLLSEVPLGEGILNLKEMVDTLRARDPDILFGLEMITRDPLKIPIFTEKYWATFDDSYSPLPGRDLAKVFKLVHDHHPKNALPRITGLSPADQVKAEDTNNQLCIDYARKNLDL
jgi:sugar phosphate isomerase/epimerase